MGCQSSSAASTAAPPEKYATNKASKVAEEQTAQSSHPQPREPERSTGTAPGASPGPNSEPAPGQDGGLPSNDPLLSPGEPGCEGASKKRVPLEAVGLYRDQDGDLAHEFWEEDRRGNLRRVSAVEPVSKATR